jgi:hypothetical protein
MNQRSCKKGSNCDVHYALELKAESWRLRRALGGALESYCLPVTARKTRSSTATERLNIVALPASGIATFVPLPLSAGPAGFAPVTVVSPGWSEMRVVLGVQLLVARQVSRTKTWRKPLLVVAAEFGVEAADVLLAWLGVTATKATNLPDALTEGKIASVPTSAPCGSVETSCVEGAHDASAPKQVSRK